MSFSLLDSISGLVRSVPPESLAHVLKEPQAQVGRALEAASPLLLAGVAQYCHDLNRSGRLLEVLDRTPVDMALIPSVAPLFSGLGVGVPAFLALGHTAFQAVFPDRESAVALALAKVAGLRAASAAQVLSFVMALVVLTLKQHVEKENLGAADLQELMAAQMPSIGPRLDARLSESLHSPSVSSPSLPSSPLPVPETLNPPPAAAPVVGAAVQQAAWKWRRWLAWGAWGGAVVLSVVWFGKLSNPSPSDTTETPVLTKRPTPSASTAPSRAMVFAPGLEKIYFDSERYETPDSTTRRLTAILEHARVHGNSRVLLTGYHDAGNESEPVLRLARQRAMAVRSAIIASGVSEDRIVVEKKSEQKALVGEREASRVEVSIAQ
jgi:outer membrane protein OmpA-like peptidoglycan-associated protein